MNTQGPSVKNFIETFCRPIRGRYAGEPVHLRPYQDELLNEMFTLDENGLWQRKMNLVLLPRKQGKSFLVSGIAIWALFCLKGQHQQIFAAAGSKEQAGIIYEMCSKMISQEPELADEIKIYRNGTIENTNNGHIFRVLSADGDLAHGLEPTLSLIDELHTHKNGKLTEALLTGSASLDQSMAICITTPGSGEGSYLKDLVDHGVSERNKGNPDKTFYMYWNELPADSNHRDEKVWEQAIPGLDDIVHRDYYRSQVNQLPEGEFKRLHLAIWTAAQESFLPYGVWDGLEQAPALKRTDELVLGLDGAFSNDSTALIGATREGHIYTLGLWERGEDAPEDWHVDFIEVRERIEQLCEQYNVRVIAIDPFYAMETMVYLEQKGYPVETFRTNSAQMLPATQSFFTSCIEGTIKHDHSPQLRNHIANAFIKSDRNGMKIQKEYKGSSKKIDAAVAAIIAHYSAIILPEAQARPSYAYV